MLRNELRKALVFDGVRLEIVATEITTNEWSLAVINEAGVSSNWYEFFTTPEAALAEAVRVIEEEGVDEFTDIEGFEYLLQQSRE